jgi:hypothetical protein
MADGEKLSYRFPGRVDGSQGGSGARASRAAHRGELPAIEDSALGHPDGTAAFGAGLAGRRFLWNVKA